MFTSLNRLTDELIEEQYRHWVGFNPNPMQQEMFWQLAASDADVAVLLKSPTGSGKTEAVFVPSLCGRQRLFMIYPARSLVEDQQGRFERIFQRLSAEAGQRYSFVLDTGGDARRRVFEQGKETTLEQWNPRRHLYDGDVILTTLDKFLWRFFGFGEQQKSYIFPFRIHYGARRSLFCFDEAHSYDDVAFTNFVRLVKALYVANLDLVVMTATMPPAYAQELNFLHTLDFADERRAELESMLKREYPDTTLCYIPKAANSTLAEQMAELAYEHVANGQRLIITVEAVRDAVTLYQILEVEGMDGLFLYHGRLPNYVRQKVYSQLKGRERNNQGYCLVTTSAIEVGCDLNAHVLITEICNPEQLIQRAGRCNRRGKIPDAQVIVVGDRIHSYTRKMSEEREARFRTALINGSGKPLDTSSLLTHIQKEPTFNYRSEILFDMLYEYVYESALENKPLHDRGLIITRSWEPSATLTTRVVTERRGGWLENAVSVPISRCATWREENLATDCRVLIRRYERQQYEYEVRYEEVQEPWHGGWVYFRDIVIEVPRDDFEPRLGHVEIPKVFHRIRNDGYRARLKLPLHGDSNVWFNYLDWQLDRSEPPTEKEQIDE